MSTKNSDIAPAVLIKEPSDDSCNVLVAGRSFRQATRGSRLRRLNVDRKSA